MVHNELKEKLRSEEEIDYSNFERIFLEVLNKHAPIKKKTVRANDKPFMTKALRKAIMRRSALKNKYVNQKTIYILFPNHQIHILLNNMYSNITGTVPSL